MKKKIIYGMIAFFVLLSQPVFAQETQQEPEPPKIPEPSPLPEPIISPKSEKDPVPFPKETESEKIQRLTVENKKLKEQNSNLEIKISELNESIENLHKIIMEQIKVIMNLVSKVKMFASYDLSS